MESIRLLIRRMEKGDEEDFVSGIADRALHIAYGFPPEMDDALSAKIFERFSGLEGGYSLIEKGSGKMIGFLLDVEPELPENLRTGLPGSGRTLAYAVFPSWQRKGYMLETLQAVIPELLQAAGMDPERKVWEIQLEDGAFTLLLMGTENRTIKELDEPVRLVVMETKEAACTGLMKAAMCSKRLGVSLGRLLSGEK